MLYRLISVDTTYCIMTLIIGVDKLLITLRLVKSYPPSAFPHAEFYGGGSFFRLYSLAFVRYCSSETRLIIFSDRGSLASINILT